MSHKDWLTIVLALLVVCLSFIGVAYYQVASRSSVQYFAVLPNNTSTPVVARERPNVSTKALLSWVTLAATATFSFDFVNLNDQLEKLRDFFTTDGYNNFTNSLSATGMLKTIVDKKLVLSAVAIGTAIVLEEEQAHSSHTWRVQVPILVRYQSANVNETRQQLVEVLVTQVPTSDAPKGIGIAQYITRETTPELTR
jgi:intracellular multiplication protein IcmL